MRFSRLLAGILMAVMCAGLAHGATVKKPLNADAIVPGLPLKAGQKTVSDDGKIKSRWDIDGLDENYNEKASFEIVGNNQSDADTVAWHCVKYDAAGNRASLKADNNACYQFFVMVIGKVSLGADQVANIVISQAEKNPSKMVTADLDGILVETDGSFFFLRKIAAQ